MGSDATWDNVSGIRPPRRWSPTAAPWKTNEDSRKDAQPMLHRCMPLRAGAAAAHSCLSGP
eukprot:11206409-Lingulodinium_polyedra.AAC.1